jgi:hypothetical protein
MRASTASGKETLLTSKVRRCATKFAKSSRTEKIIIVISLYRNRLLPDFEVKMVDFWGAWFSFSPVNIK